MEVQNNFTRGGAVAAFVGVALGAFGAHAIKDRVSPYLLSVWQTGVQYHIIHALALLFVGLLLERALERDDARAVRMLRIVGKLFIAGIIIFGGSLYALTLTGARVLGAITPLGGVCFLTGWALLAVVTSSRSTSNR